MKKVFFLVVLASFLLTSCGNRAITNVARDFLQAYYIDHDFNRARMLSTAATHEHMQQWIMIFELTPAEANPHLFQSFEIYEIDALSNRATVHYRVDNTRRQLMLRQIDGRWFVDLPMDMLSVNRAIFSLSLNRPESGGFASAQSRPARLGGAPVEE